VTDPHKTGRISLMDELARSLAGMGPDWSPFKYEAIGGNDRPMLIVGAVAPTISRGPRKGRPNWQKRDPATERSVVILGEQMRRFEREWSAKTGLCARCVGHGDTLCGWSVVDGNRYRVCKKCNGTGKASEVRA